MAPWAPLWDGNSEDRYTAQAHGGTALNTLVLNLYAGPGAGKSTLCAGLFAALKLRGVDCEMAREYAKDVVWEGRTHLLDNQLYLFSKQLKRLDDLVGKVRVVVTDAPLLLSVMYARNAFERPKSRRIFINLVKSEYQRFDNRNVIVSRIKPYNPGGRMQTAEEASRLDLVIRDILGVLNLPVHKEVEGGPGGLDALTRYVLSETGLQDALG